MPSQAAGDADHTHPPGQAQHAQNQGGFVMTYRKRRRDLTAHLRSMGELEQAMQDADMNGAQLARAAGVSTSYVSLIRQGQAPNVSEELAVAMERALGLKRGVLFAYGQPSAMAAGEA